MNSFNISNSAMKRLPIYLHYIKLISNDESKYISSTKIANDLKLGEVLVRKDLALICGKGKPKIGYLKQELEECLNRILNTSKVNNAIIIGAGKLGQALQSFEGFKEIGFKIIASFDNDDKKIDNIHSYHINHLKEFCKNNQISVGIITVNEENAQSICDLLIENNINKIWNFSAVQLTCPSNVKVKNENLAASLAVLSLNN